MDIKELKKKIADNFDWAKFKCLVDENYIETYAEDNDIPLETGVPDLLKEFEEKVGLPFTMLEKCRGTSGDHDSYFWTFKIGEHFYQILGYYSSYDGNQMENISSFYEVQPVKKEITVWQKIKI